MTLSPVTHLWMRRIAWLGLLAPLFFLTYNGANQYASQATNVSHLYFQWETAIPFIPWTIIPYWSLDLFYGLSFICCQTNKEIDRHGLRLLTIQLISVTCFVLFPLQFSFQRPETDGIFGWLFSTLNNFDLPYNQAPSLHISLTVAISVCFLKLRPHWVKYVVYGMGLLICLSVLTTYQHHFIDIPTGLIVGFFALWLWPDKHPSPLRLKHPLIWHMAMFYALPALILIALSVWVSPWFWVLGWGVLSLLLMSLCYLRLGGEGLQKDHGKHSVAVRVLFAPFLLGARLNAYLWTRGLKTHYPIMDNVLLGRIGTANDIEDLRAVCDMSAEIAYDPQTREYINFPTLDFTTPNTADLITAAHTIESMQRRGLTLVACALGIYRSAITVMAWLLITQRANSVQEAEIIVRRQAPHVRIPEHARERLATLLEEN